MRTIGAIQFFGETYGAIVCNECKPESMGEEWQLVYEMESESDTPMHCDKCEGFMRNRLTHEGMAYVKEQHEINPSEVTAEWIEYYKSEGELG